MIPAHEPYLKQLDGSCAVCARRDPMLCAVLRRDPAAQLALILDQDEPYHASAEGVAALVAEWETRR